MSSKTEQYAEFMKYCRVYEIPSDANLSKLIGVVPENLRAIVTELAHKGRATGESSHDSTQAPEGIFLYCDIAQGICGGFRALRRDGENWVRRSGEIETGRVYYWSDDLPQMTRNNHFN